MRDTEPSRTAELMALCRASERFWPETERVVDDPYAELFLRPDSAAWLATARTFGTGRRHVNQTERWLTHGTRALVLARHRYIENAMLAAKPEQVLLLGAGYDTRAWRLPLGDIPIFEVDHPATAARKSERVASLPPRPNRRVVPVDFSSERWMDKLVAAGFQRGLRTFASWEGVSMYLPEAAVRETLSWLAAEGVTVAWDYTSPTDAEGIRGAVHRALPHFLKLFGEPVRFQIPAQEIGAFCASVGLTMADHGGPQDLAALFPRPVSVYPWAGVVVARGAAP